MATYRGLCAQCGAGENSGSFKARPEGRKFDVDKWELADDAGRKLHFFVIDHRNNRVCGSCYLDNNKLLRAKDQVVRVSSAIHAPPRKRLNVFNLDSPSTPGPSTTPTVTTPPSVTITERPRNSHRRKIPRIDESDQSLFREYLVAHMRLISWQRSLRRDCPRKLHCRRARG
jgi:hypothetical protein